jgi:hypothetical protein
MLMPLDHWLFGERRDRDVPDRRLQVQSCVDWQEAELGISVTDLVSVVCAEIICLETTLAGLEQCH